LDEQEARITISNKQPILFMCFEFVKVSD